ncbi:aminotransferase class III-fold pyridoxal phosphate-dependent enzyme [Kribbella sp. NBC_01505]|uniref:aminotransferase class III-fold pyridoxal phosphate-dependent enzyme n=1 Tax=Kribbella sp. NBC_01505 TaxID=2903580 RepID=UPI003863DCD3
MPGPGEKRSPIKTDDFPAFDWPRVPSPAVYYAEEWESPDLLGQELAALRTARELLDRYGSEIACFVYEPIQGEGGDRHLRPQFLSAMELPCADHDVLTISEVVESEGLFARAADLGSHLLTELRRLGGEFPQILSRPRGQGLLCAITVASREQRDTLLRITRERYKCLLLPSGEREIRWRPALTVTQPEIADALTSLRRALQELTNRTRQQDEGQYLSPRRH